MQLPEEQITTFITACGEVGVKHEDVSVRLFVESLQENVVEWFYMLLASSITCWEDIKTIFEHIFKTTEEYQDLLVQLVKMKKEPMESMRYFVAKYDWLIISIPWR